MVLASCKCSMNFRSVVLPASLTTTNMQSSGRDRTKPERPRAGCLDGYLPGRLRIRKGAENDLGPGLDSHSVDLE